MRLHRKANSLGRHGGSSLFTSSVWFLGIVSVLLDAASGQNVDEIDADLCGCSPGTYEFAFDFSLTCPPVNITGDGGVAATSCQIVPFRDADENITDLVPVSRFLGFPCPESASILTQFTPLCYRLWWTL